MGEEGGDGRVGVIGIVIVIIVGSGAEGWRRWGPRRCVARQFGGNLRGESVWWWLEIDEWFEMEGAKHLALL